MIHKQMDRDHTRADNGSCQRAAGSAENGSGDSAGTDCATIFEAIFLDPRACRYTTLTVNANRRARRARELRVNTEARAVGQSDRFGPQMHRTAGERMAI